MTALPAAVDVVRITFRSSQGSSTNILNRLFFKYVGSVPTVPEMQVFAGSCHEAFHTHLLPFLMPQYYLQETFAVDLGKDTNPEVSHAQAYPGTGSTSSLPPGDCILVNYQVDRRYRGGHPRFYQSGGESGQTDDSGTWLQPYIGNYLNQHNAFLAEIAALRWTGQTSLTHVSVSYYSGFTNILVPGKRAKVESTPRTSPQIDTVVGTSVNPQVTSQRRRDQVP